MSEPDHDLAVTPDAQRPIRTDREETEVEFLVPAYHRRVTVAEHAEIRSGIQSSLENLNTRRAL